MTLQHFCSRFLDLNMDSKNTVSIVMCTYNGERYLRYQMDSILSQTYPIMEIIVQDDCSTDQTMNILRDYAARYPQIKVYQNAQNLGFNRNFQSAVMRAKGRLIAIADQDDVWQKDKIRLQVEAIGEKSLCYHDVTRGTEMKGSVVVSYKPYMESLLFRSILGHTMLLKADFIQHEARWDLSRFYDRSIAISSLLYGNGMTRISKPLVWHREHEGEVSAMDGLSSPKVAKWKPYLKGWSDYKVIQRSRIWQTFYSTLLAEPALQRYPEAKKITECLLGGSLLSTIRLCLLSLKNRQKVYPTDLKGIIGIMRGLFYPAIFAYFNKHYFI